MKPLHPAHTGLMTSLAPGSMPLQRARQTVLSVSIVSVLLLSVSACGQKGPLVRPSAASSPQIAAERVLKPLGNQASLVAKGLCGPPEMA